MSSPPAGRGGPTCPGSIWDSCPDAGTNTPLSPKPLTSSEKKTKKPKKNGFYEPKFQSRGHKMEAKCQDEKHRPQQKSFSISSQSAHPPPLSASHHMGRWNNIKGLILLLVLHAASSSAGSRNKRENFFEMQTRWPCLRAGAAKAVALFRIPFI